MPPPKHGGSGTSKPFAVSFSNTSRKPLHTPPQSARPRVSSSLRHHRHHISHDESDEEEEFPVAEEVTGFDMGGAISKNAPKEKEPLVIKVESRNNWRDRPGTNRRSRNLLPQEVQAQAAGNVAVVETETPSMTYGLSLAPAQNEGADERQSDVAMANTAPISEPEPRAPLTQDEIALQALIRESEGGETTRRSDLVIESTRNQGRYDEASSFRADVATRPDQASLDAYEAVPVEEFGAALLRGMGWKEGQAIGRGDYGDTTAAKEARVPARRPGFLGIGAKDIGGAKGAEVEIGAWGKAAMRKGSRKGGDGSGSTEGVYMPVVMKSKTTGECLTEEEFKLRQKEPSERKANGRSDERSSHSNGRDKELSRRYDNESDTDRDRRRRHDKRRNRSRSSGAHDRRRYDDDEDDGKRSSRDHRLYRDRDDNDYQSRRRSRDRGHRDSGYSRRDEDHRPTRVRDRDSDRTRSDRDRNRDRDRHR